MTIHDERRHTYSYRRDAEPLRLQKRPSTTTPGSAQHIMTMTWKPISTPPPPLVRVLVWCRGEGFTAFRCENGDWCTDPEPTLHPLDDARYPFLDDAADCGITHWAEIVAPA